MIHYDGVIVCLYDNRLLVKATKSARHQLQDNTLVSPYPGAKEMILIPDITEAINLTNLFELIKNDLKNATKLPLTILKVSISYYQIIEYLDLLLYTNSIFRDAIKLIIITN